MDIKKEFEPLRKKYSLPNYEELNQEFEILYVSPILEIAFPLRFVRRRISDKFIWVCNLFQNLLNPNPSSMIGLQESKYFDNSDRDKISKLLKEFMFFERQSLIQDLNPDEEKDAKLIKEMFQIWIKHKKDLILITEKLRDGWRKETKTEKDHYFG